MLLYENSLPTTQMFCLYYTIDVNTAGAYRHSVVQIS